LDITQYLRRIAYDGSPRPGVETLHALHRSHMLAVPFENLDIVILHRPIVLDEARLLYKIVGERRGGFCYELNGAFAVLLRALGFRVDLLNAQVARAAGGWGIEFDHMALRVQLDEPWLVDVGYGDSFVEPLRLDESGEQAQAVGRFRLARDGEHISLARQEDGQWNRQYRFTLRSHALTDFTPGCHYHQTSPETSFTQKRVCSRAAPNGRITLSDMKLVITQNGVRQERMLHSDEEYTAALRDYFGVVVKAY